MVLVGAPLVVLQAIA